MGNAKKILISLLVIGLLTAVIGTGTFATFTAQTTNSSNTFSTGTLVLSNAKSGGTTCLSTGGGTTDTNANSTGCDNLINASVKKPGDSASGTVTIKNEGSLAGSSSELWSTACTASDASGENYHGTGDPCGVILLTIHDDTNNQCYYPTTTFGTPESGACTATAGKTLSDFVTNSSASHLSTGALSAGASRTYTISMTMPSSAGNTMQGRTASIDFNWKLNQ